MQFVCPLPYAWADVYKMLHARWESKGRRGPEPPIPLVLGGWHYSSDLDKQSRWAATLEWAKEQGCEDLIPTFEESALYQVETLSTSYPEQHYRPDRYETRQKSSGADIESAMAILGEGWAQLAGPGVAEHTSPHSISGAKARRLVVAVNSPSTPPWGSWHQLGSGPEAAAFTELRARINAAVAPVHFDHIDFTMSPENLRTS